MKPILITFIFGLFIVCSGLAQTTKDIKMLDNGKMDSISSDKLQKKWSNLISIGGKYYQNPLKNTRTTLADNGFLMDEYAVEYNVSFGKLPKIYYFQQLGTLQSTNYASVLAFGLKKDVRWEIFKNSHFILTPYAEFGVGYVQLKMAKGITKGSIGTVLNSEIEQYVLENVLLTGDVGLDLGFNFNVDNRRVSLTVNGGYITNFPTGWRIASSVEFKEKINITSPYVGLTLRMDMVKECCCGKMCSSK